MNGTPLPQLTLTEKSPSGCGCCAPKDTTTTAAAAPGEITAEFAAAGLTCGSCASRVTSAVAAIPDVTDVHIDLVPGGSSTVTVRSTQPVPADVVRSAVEQAGYSLTEA